MLRYHRHIRDELNEHYAALILDLLSRGLQNGERSFGYEYEFMPEHPLSTTDMTKIYQCLPGLGFRAENRLFHHPSGMQIAFEPGGQIEYISTPMKSGDENALDDGIQLIQATNASLAGETGIRYLPYGYLPDRADIPMLLPVERYVKMHRRMARTGSRGREMMKGTASVHLHVSIGNVAEILPLFNRLHSMTDDTDFRMSDIRRDIWNNTDPSRCGMPVYSPEKLQSSEELVLALVDFALDAEDLYRNIPYRFVPCQTDEAFMEHWTTIFTDLRLNFKGPTMEMRTMDSLPPEEFFKRWRRFVSSFDDINPN